MAFAFYDGFDTLENDLLKLEVIEKAEGDDKVLPFYFYQIYRKPDLAPVGKVSIRIGHNYHSYYNGNVGYEVDPEYRGRHYSSEAVKLVLPVARFHGMDHIFLTCEEDNVSSYRSMERLGAELVEITEIPDDWFAWYRGIPRYRIYRLGL